MIVPMKKVLLLALKADCSEVLERLRAGQISMSAEIDSRDLPTA